MASDSRGCRLLSDLNSAFRRDPDIDEYDFLPVPEPKHNRSPLVLQEHKLGMESWSIKILFQYAYYRLISWRKNSPQTKFIDPSELCSITRAILLVNADCATAWNTRKELVDNAELSVTEDLKFGALILKKHPKSPETFSHRKWLLHRFVDNYLASSVGSNASTGSNACDKFVNMDAIDVNMDASLNGLCEENGPELINQPDYSEQIRRELSICKIAADNHPCNYNAWSHAIWVLQHCLNCSLQVVCGELHSTEDWIKKHVSDHSGLHYRQFLLKCLSQQAEKLSEQYLLNYRNTIQKEMHLISDLIKCYPGHEALWYHRRYVFQALCESCDKGFKEPNQLSDQLLENQQKKTKFENERQVLLINEVDTVSTTDLLGRDKYNQQLAQKYLDWIQTYCRR
ncbi:protein prenyltransferase alpha subunit repeat-containing protein 1-B-like isoform X1 [Saccostrea cucullata]|uniref:protein prenyltransferase alpha subunit repeat-containing protein 1-B-like isoform X1 n=2 Tax=Saccostrea cuccullata TaxID=36930 RepID=UPI002ED494A4